MKKILLLCFLLLFSAFNICFAEIPAELLQKAESGDAEAQYELGMIYFSRSKRNSEDCLGQNDYKSALFWFERSALSGNSDAQYSLAERLMAQENYVESIKWLHIASDQNPKASYRLGDLYLQGKWLEKNEEKAFLYYLDAAQKGFNDAKVKVGILYFSGTGVQQDRVQGYVWMMEAYKNEGYGNYSKLIISHELEAFKAKMSFKEYKEAKEIILKKGLY